MPNTAKRCCKTASVDRVRQRLAEVDGNRTRQAEVLGLVGFEDRDVHQDVDTSPAPGRGVGRYHSHGASGTACRHEVHPTWKRGSCERPAGSGARLSRLMSRSGPAAAWANFCYADIDFCIAEFILDRSAVLTRDRCLPTFMEILFRMSE